MGCDCGGNRTGDQKIYNGYYRKLRLLAGPRNNCNSAEAPTYARISQQKEASDLELQRSVLSLCTVRAYSRFESPAIVGSSALEFSKGSPKAHTTKPGAGYIIRSLSWPPLQAKVGASSSWAFGLGQGVDHSFCKEKFRASCHAHPTRKFSSNRSSGNSLKAMTWNVEATLWSRDWNSCTCQREG